MVSTRHGAFSRKSVHTQTDCPSKRAAVQVSGCGECLSLLLPSAGGRETACVRCEQVDDLVRLVAELKEEVQRLRDIRECEREIDWWSDSLQDRRERDQGETPQRGVDPLPCCHRAEGGDLRVEEEWRQVPARPRRRCPPLPAPPSQVPLNNRFEALELERPVGEDEFVKLQRVRRQLPPGPIPLPILGTLIQLNFQFNCDLLMKMAKIHGNVFTLWFGWAPVIVLNGFQAVKDGMTTHPEDVSGRLVSPFFRAMAKGKGIMLATGHTWKQQRRFALKTLRNLGLGKRGLEHRVQEEARYLVEFFASMKENPLDPSFPLVHSVSNVICAVVFGHRFSREDETFRELIRATEHLFKFGGSFIHHLYEIFPWLMCRLPGPHKKALSCYDVLSSFTRREIRNHTESEIPDEPQDFIDFYLAHIEKSKDEPRSTYNEENMVYSINDLFLGGSETTSTTLNWGLIYMVANPDIQEKVQKELDAVLGPSQLICYEDRRKLPYTNAVVHEIQRFSNIISVGMPRVCVRNTTLLGFPLKKGSIVLPNIASSLYDPEHWETPRQFNPGHFLDKDGNFVSQEAFLPFSIGHRVCLGENLARTELFIFFANLLRAFTFRLPKGVTKINTEPILGGTLQPHPYKVCAIPR